MGDAGLEVGKPVGTGGLCSWLVLGRDRASDDVGLTGDIIDLSEVKKLDVGLLGDGVGGICDRVSVVRSEREGLGLLGFRRAVSAVGEGIFLPSISSGMLEDATLDTDVCADWRGASSI